MSSRWIIKLPVAFAFLAVLYLFLLIPDSAPPRPTAGERESFVWNQDEYWSLLETRFKQIRSTGCNNLSPLIHAGLLEVEGSLKRLQSDALGPEAAVFFEIETRFFELGILLAACPQRLQDYLKTFGELRIAIKNQSVRWDMNGKAAHHCAYRLLYGGREAVEEVMLQAPRAAVPNIELENDEPSVTPCSAILGARIHSGDILVSRGGAPTSALIARGNDYPGNFSHVGLVYIDENTNAVSIVESHIERGVVISSVEDYLRDTKLRVMILRLRADLSCMQTDPMLPHKAAKHALQKAQAGHIPYDFTMDAQDHSKAFCSEVVSEAYSYVGVTLWTGLSHISNPGAKRWLSAFGVRNFTTQEPSDLEYDPQLRVVAEWRDFETLYTDRIDNAVIDVMLEGAGRGDRLDYEWYLLPVARAVKVYCVIINQFGGVGPIPEGMNATAALRNKWFTSRHRKIKERLLALACKFEQDNGYSPPYWELIKLAKQAYSS